MELTYIKNNNQIDMFSIIENWKQNKDKINEELFNETINSIDNLNSETDSIKTSCLYPGDARHCLK